MKPLPTVAALFLAAGCMDTGLGASAEDPVAPAHLLAPGQDVLVFFRSGVDEPPASAPIIACPSASGLCLGGMSSPAPIRQTDTGYALTWGTTDVTLATDGTGAWDPASGPRVAITWMTEPG